MNPGYASDHKNVLSKQISRFEMAAISSSNECFFCYSKVSKD